MASKRLGSEWRPPGIGKEQSGAQLGALGVGVLAASRVTAIDPPRVGGEPEPTSLTPEERSGLAKADAELARVLRQDQGRPQKSRPRRES